MKTPIIALFLFLFNFSISAQITPLQSKILRQEFSQHLNNLRQSLELGPLIHNEILRKAAKNQSVYLTKIKKLSHQQSKSYLSTPLKRVQFFDGNEFDRVGENVLYTKEVKLPLRQQDLADIAKDMFTAWKNSPGHYANMINPYFSFEGIDFHLGNGEPIIYATQVFAKRGVQIEGQLSDNAFGLELGDGNCTSANRLYSNSFLHMGNALQIQGNDIILNYHNIEILKQVLSEEKDGFAIDLLTSEQLSCGRPNELDFSPLYDGILLKPIYRDEILANNTAQGDYRIISKIATIPKDLQEKQLFPSLLILKNKTVCKYVIPAFSPSKSYELRPIKPKLINPQNVVLKREGIIASQELKYDFQTNKINPVKYPKLETLNYEIHSVKISSYSSVEGEEEKNIDLHDARAKTIKRHLLKHLNIAPDKISIDSKENWDKMNYQLQYYFADSLLNISKDSLKQLLKTGDKSLPWDSLLFEQRKSLATVNYLGTLKEDVSENEILSINLRSALLQEDTNLANKVLYNLYHSDSDLSDLIYEDVIFSALLQNPKLVQNVAAIFTKSYYNDVDRKTEFLSNWINRKEELTKFGIYNLLHLQTLLSIDLMNIWDLSSKRLSNVIHPRRVKNLIPKNLDNELMLNLHLTFIDYFGQINDQVNITKSFNFISNYFRVHSLTLQDELDLALFFNHWSNYERAIRLLLPKFKEGKLNEQGIFILLYTINRKSKGSFPKIYKQLTTEAIKINKNRWCHWIYSEFQILRDEDIKNLFCEECKELIHQHY